MSESNRHALIVAALIILLLLLTPKSVAVAAGIQCGDIDGNGQASDIGDLIFLVEYVFAQGSAPALMATVDCDGDGATDIGDLVCYVEYMFDGGHPPYCPSLVNPDHEDLPGHCLSKSEGITAPGKAMGSMYAEAVGGDIHIHHLNAIMNCCPGYCVTYSINGNNITAFEQDTLDLCECLCLYDLETVLYDMAPGQYIITLMDDFMGVETVGVDTVVVISRLIDFDASGCLAGKAEPDTMEIIYTYSGDTLTLDNLNVEFLCLAVFEVDFAQVGNTLRFYETNIDTSGPLCVCPYNIHAAAAPIPPGTYTAEIYTREMFGGGPFELLDRRTLVLAK